MAISPINNLNNNIRNLSFGENKEKQDTEKKPQISTQTKVIVGTGLAALAAVGIYIATRGKSGKTNTSGLNPASGNEKPLEILKEYTIDAFKKAGHKFEKGRAITSDGKNYTGTLIRTDKNGNKFVSEFKDGVFQKATKNNDVISEVTFNDNIKTIKTKNSNIRIDTGIGKIVTLQKNDKGIKQFYYTKDGVLKYVDHEFSESGTTGIKELTKFSPDGKTKLFTIRSNKSVKFFDSNGKISDGIRIDLDRDGDSWLYKGLDYRKDVTTGSKEYKIINQETGSFDAVLQRVDRNDYKSNWIRLYHNNKKYTVDLDTNEITLNSGEKVTDKVLSEKILAKKNQLIEKINTIDKEAMNIKSQLQEAIRDVDKFITG